MLLETCFIIAVKDSVVTSTLHSSSHQKSNQFLILFFMLWHTAIEMIMVKKMNRIIKSCREVNAISAFRGAYNKYDSKYGEGNIN
jgi:hypothetical protein